MEIDITEFVAGANPFDYSRSIMEAGADAGPSSWRNALQAERLLKTESEYTAAREYLRTFGAWTDDEVNAWSTDELNALVVQLVSGDMREPVGFEINAAMDDAQWSEYYDQAQSGNVSGRIFRGEGNRIYYELGD